MADLISSEIDRFSLKKHKKRPAAGG